MTDNFEIFDVEEEKPKRSKNFFKRITWLVVILLILGYLSTSIYQVGPSEMGLVLTFGKYTSSTGPGIHWRLPYPFQSHRIVDIKTLKKIEIGFRTVNYRGRIEYQPVTQESLMITGDENIVSLEAVVQYRIADPVKFEFRVLNGFDMVKFATESVLREMVAINPIDNVLTSERDRIAMETAAKVQKILDSYGAGIKVENVYLQEVAPPDEVVKAFDDVNSAKQDKEKFINEANRYANDVIPKAEGQAQKILRAAEAYSYETVAIATGETKRFKAMLKEYKAARDITRKRIILEAIQDLLENSKQKIIVDSSGTLKLLNLPEIGGGTK
ncbi:protease FtsH subunit HflK [Marinitoga hydrogenitolerans DSM 16785]|uniref:Protein HflK n=1 Tax=Marinitoga hydrogenitolerans (strain DSM 16785 / JCM 12826 / AT1271) TaxID=1122195 RepID=A0A1M4TJ91_MARH1|nr:FtsH protease activity modulator HflK [Marinitoga hydrogenitolerans]SHE44496.1 protease FtsH subunit HflK [Marinitoga hydrogenitolerans DSM 16785]